MSIVRVSNGIAGEANGASETGAIRSISGDNQFLVFESSAGNLVSGDTNGVKDVFLYNIQTGAIVRISTGSAGEQGTGQSLDASISVDGRFIAFKTTAVEISGQTTTSMVVRKDLLTGALSVAGESHGGFNTDEGQAISGDGRYVAFRLGNQILRYDFQTNTTYVASAAADGSVGTGSAQSISADGNFILFYGGNGLVPESSPNWQVFMKNASTGEIFRLSSTAADPELAGGGDSFAPNISSDGRFAVFHSYASDVTNELDTNGTRDVIRLDLLTGEAVIVSRSENGTLANSGGGSHTPTISANGRYVAFASASDNLVANDTNGAEDIFVKDMDTGKIIRVSVAADGTQGNGLSYRASISEDGRYVAFSSNSTNLVTGDANGTNDVFLVDLADTGFLNAAPTAISLANAIASVDENTPTATRIKVADIVITDDALGTNVLGLTGADAASFEIDGSSLYLKAGTTLNFEGKPSFHVAVSVDDAAVGVSPDATSATHTLQILDVNEAPSITLANTVGSLSEASSTAAPVKVADIVVTDDALGTRNLALTGADAALFEITSSALYLKAGTSIDFETKASYAVAVTVDDPTVGTTPDSSTPALTLAITDVNEAPSVTLTNLVAGITEHSAMTVRQKVADIVVSDDGLGSEALALTGADSGRFEIDGASLYLKAGTYLEHEQTPTLEVAVTVDDLTVGAIPDDDQAVVFEIVAIDAINDILGTDAAETILGTAGSDRVLALGGNDRVSLGLGNDIASAGTGNDLVAGGRGRDTLAGDSGNDKLLGGDDNDVIRGQAGNDKLYGDHGNDRLFGGLGHDKLWGGVGNDHLYGEAGNDRFYTDAGSDILEGGSGTDTVIAAGTRSGYKLTKLSDGVWHLVDRDGGTGSDVLIGIDKVVFNDGAVVL